MVNFVTSRLNQRKMSVVSLSCLFLFCKAVAGTTVEMMFSQVGNSLNCCHDTEDSDNRKSALFHWPLCEREINLYSVNAKEISDLVSYPA